MSRQQDIMNFFTHFSTPIFGCFSLCVMGVQCHVCVFVCMVGWAWVSVYIYLCVPYICLGENEFLFMYIFVCGGGGSTSACPIIFVWLGWAWVLVYLCLCVWGEYECLSMYTFISFCIIYISLCVVGWAWVLTYACMCSWMDRTLCMFVSCLSLFFFLYSA